MLTEFRANGRHGDGANTPGLRRRASSTNEPGLAEHVRELVQPGEPREQQAPEERRRWRRLKSRRRPRMVLGLKSAVLAAGGEMDRVAGPVTKAVVEVLVPVAGAAVERVVLKAMAMAMAMRSCAS